MTSGRSGSRLEPRQVLGWPLLCWLSICGLVVAQGVAAGAEEPPVTIRTSVDRTQVLIGEPIHYVITIEHQAGLTVRLPSFHATIGPFAIEDAGTVPTHPMGERVIEEWWYRLVSYSTGEQIVPEPVATYRGVDGADHEVRGPTVAITVKSLLPTDWKSQDIRDVKPLIAINGHAWVWWGLGLLALLGGVASGVWWRRRAASVVTPPPRPAHELALEALERLCQDQLPMRGQLEEYYVRLSGIVRVYVERRFSLRAPEMTTEEFFHVASEAQALSHDHRQRLKEFLMRCDLVKFARYQPVAGEADEAFAAARRFVEETVPLERPLHLAAPTSMSR